jgi:Beta/Gamma crystallin
MSFPSQTLLYAVLVGVLTIATGSTANAGPEMSQSGGPYAPPETCIYYEHENFKGEIRNIALGVTRRYVGDHWNDRISSVSCAPRCRLQVWEHRDFIGASKSFGDRGATAYVGDDWNDRISSARVVCDVPYATNSDCSYGPQTCHQGFVWREASADDRVCVLPETRDSTRQENALGASRRAGSGAYGPDTCIAGYVWREAFNGDTICVPSESRDRARRDNARAQLRIACSR